MNEEIEFTPFKKTARLTRECYVTEKLDGTNASIYITESGDMLVGSRNRWITPANDNYGFAGWAERNREELMKLGPGHHFGEWWGNGIQRAYGLKQKQFSLFNTYRWIDKNAGAPKQINKDPQNPIFQEVVPECCGVVPILFNGLFTTEAVDKCLGDLRERGSVAAPGFMKPEGVMVFLVAPNLFLKKTLDNDGKPKSLVG